MRSRAKFNLNLKLNDGVSLQYIKLLTILFVIASSIKLHAWELNEYLDKMTDKKSKQLHTESIEEVYQGKKARLVFNCKKGSNYVFFEPPDHLKSGNGGRTSLSFRSDKKKMKEISLYMSAETKSAFSLNESDLAAIKKMVTNAKILLVKYSSLMQGQQIVTFDVTGFQELYKKCMAK